MQKLIIILVLIVTEAICVQTDYKNTKQIANELFANFKPETPFYPKWGKNRAEEILESCKKQ